MGKEADIVGGGCKGAAFKWFTSAKSSDIWPVEEASGVPFPTAKPMQQLLFQTRNQCTLKGLSDKKGGSRNNLPYSTD